MSARPAGDPQAMEAAATAILGIVGKLHGVDSFVAHALPARAFEGPGRAHIDNALRSSAQSVGHTTASLQHLASKLGAGAADLRGHQQRWDADEQARAERAAKAEADARTAARRVM